MDKKCFMTTLNDVVDNYKLPVFIPKTDYSPILNGVNYSVGLFWKDSLEETAPAGALSRAAVAPVSLHIKNGVFISSKNQNYVVHKVSIKKDGVYSSVADTTVLVGGKVAIDYDGEIAIYITIRTADDSDIPSDLNLSEIIEIKTQSNPFVNVPTIEVEYLCLNEEEFQVAYSYSTLYNYVLINFNRNNFPYSLMRKIGTGKTMKECDSERTKTVLFKGEYYRYNGSLYEKI